MTYNQFFNLLKKNEIPLADIKSIFDGYLKMPFDYIGLNGDKNEVRDEIANSILLKLKQGYPAVYLAGYTEILKLKIYVNEGVLIPRIETADFIYSYIKDNYDFNHLKVLDLCTGTGIIALAIKKYFPHADVYASDISDKALETASKNIKENNLPIKLIKSDFLFDIKDTFDIIISNPPYIEDDSKDVNAPFEPRIALFSGKDGLDSYRHIFNNLKSHLNKNGIAFFECESSNIKNTIDLLHTIDSSFQAQIIPDLYQRDRFLIIKMS